MKRIGTREEVYLGLAHKTSGGMTRADIIKASKQNAKKKYISKKISTRMKTNNPLVNYKKIKSSKKQQLVDSDISSEKKQKYLNERKMARLLRRKQSKKNRLVKQKKNKLSNKKLSFNLKNNITKEYQCDNMDDINYELGYESDNETSSSSSPFKIEEMPDIDISDYF